MASQSDDKPADVDADFYDNLRTALAGGKLHQIIANAELADVLPPEKHDSNETVRILNKVGQLVSSPPGTSPVPPPGPPMADLRENELEPERVVVTKLIKDTKGRIRTNPKVLDDFATALKQDPAHEGIAELFDSKVVHTGRTGPALGSRAVSTTISRCFQQPISQLNNVLSTCYSKVKDEGGSLPRNRTYSEVEQSNDYSIDFTKGSPERKQIKLSRSKEPQIKIRSDEISNDGSVFGVRKDYEYDIPKGATDVTIDIKDKSDKDGVTFGSDNGDAKLKWNKGEEKARVRAYVNGKLGGTNHITWTVYASVPYNCLSPAQLEEQRHLGNAKRAIRISTQGATLNYPIVQGVFLGSAGSGKSSLINRLTSEGPCSSSPSTGVYTIPLSVTDSVWFKLTYNKEARELMSRILFGKSQKLPTDFERNKSTDDVAHDSQHNLQMPEGFRDPLEIMSEAATEEIDIDLKKSWSFYLTDTGEFQLLLPQLVSGPLIFFITFRLDHDLDRVFKIHYKLPNGTTSQFYESTLTVLEDILQSLASISSMGTFVYDGLQQKDIPFKPKVFLIGTHKDKLDSTPERVKKIDEYLREKIMSTSYCRDGLVQLQLAAEDQLIFTVNNLSADDSDFNQIRSSVNDLVQHEEFKTSTPSHYSHWLILGLVIRSLKKSVISFDECLSVAQQCQIQDKEELKKALHFLHTNLGIVRYFPDVGLEEALEDLVVIKPQVLFDEVTNLIVQTFTSEQDGKSISTKFTEKGIFSMKDIERVSNDFDLTSKHLVSLLKRLRIIAPVQTGKEDTYFLPCILPVAHANVHTSSSMDQHSDIPPLVVTFKCGYCPKGLPEGLITYLQTNEMQSAFQWELQPQKIFQNQVSFHIAPYNDTIVLSILPTNIRIAFIPNDQKVHPDGIKEVCPTVRQSLEKGIARVASDMNYMYGAEHSVTFDCPCDECRKDPYSAAAELQWDKGKPIGLRCCKTQKYSPLPSGYMAWSIDDTLNPAHLCKIYPRMLEVAYQWKNIGASLGIPVEDLERIEQRCIVCNDWLQEMLSFWLKQTDPPPTWQKLVDAIKHFNPRVAEEVRELIN